MIEVVEERLKLVAKQYDNRLIATTGFGYSGMVLLSHVKEVIPELPIYFIDTGYHFQETLDLRDKVISEWGLNIITISNPNPTVDFRNPIDCCYQRKVLPLLNVVKEDTVWISALRKDQSNNRYETEFVQEDGRGNLKICPLFDLTKDVLWGYIRKNNLLYNHLHDENYPSVGCYPCTVPVESGGDERSGRWQGTSKCGGECGIHTKGA